MQNKKLIRSVIAIVCMAGIVGCQQENGSPPESVSIPPITQNYGVLAEGQLVPERYIDLAFGMPGRVTKILVQEGAVVTKGQPIARLDNGAQLQAAYAQASANVEQAGVSLHQAPHYLEQGLSRAAAAGTVSAFAPAYAADELKVWDLVESGRYEQAQELEDRISSALGPVRARVGASGGGYRLAKGMMDIVGHPSGPPRLPTEPLNDEEMAALRIAMQELGWA